MATAFPPSLLREQTTLWAIAAATVSPGQSGSGAFQLGRMDGGGLWTAELGGISLRTREQVLLWRAMAAIAENGVEPLVVPMCESRYSPAPLGPDGRRITSHGDIPHSDETLFSDDTGYAQSVILIETFDAPLRATSMEILLIHGAPLLGGEKFSLLHGGSGSGRDWRLYEIKTATDLGGGHWSISFRPPLRAAVTAGTPIEFDMPRCTMRLARPDAADLTLDLRRFGAPSIGFVEYFYAPAP